ncbi:MAG: ATP-binding protein [Vicingaceae bacterium]
MKMSLKNKLVYAIMGAGALILILAMGIYVWLDIVKIKKNKEEDTKALATIIAINNEAAILFNDSLAVKESLNSLEASKDIEYACVINQAGEIFAESDFSKEKKTVKTNGRESVKNFIEVYHNIESEKKSIGTLYIKVNLKQVNLQIKKASIIGGLILFLAIVITYLFTRFLQKMITKPILELAKISSKISKEKDYSTKIEIKRDDEIGTLVKSFNNMLQEIYIQNKELTISKKKAEKSSKAKEQFLANMSHEIRTPLNGIEGMTRLLQETDLNEEQKKFVSTIKISSANLMIIINDILDISKIEAGKLTIEKIKFDLKNNCEKTLETLSFKAEEKSIALIFNYDDNISSVLLGDPTRITQVLINLINNAIKFTKSGSVNLTCTLVKETEHYNRIKFEVNDTGIGIAKDKIDKIFESFSQEDESTTRKFGGTGLGLSISKELVELFKGKLEVSSKKGVGTSFYFTIDLPRTKDELNEESEILMMPESLENKSVLLVEDNEINQFLAKTILSKWKMNVTVAENGEIAIEKLKANSFDVILMDVQMPVMGGFEATSIIRKKMKLKTPIIALTANAIKGDDNKCIEIGMDDYISKPFDHSILYNKILKLINYGRTIM